MPKYPPVFIIGHIRSGTTIFHSTIQQAASNTVDLDADDVFEGRLYWQKFGVRIGSPKTGTYCEHAPKELATPEAKVSVQNYLNELTRNGKQMINKNPHLANKIDFVNALLPDAKFIQIIREPYATISSTKLQFEASYLGENYWDLPFRHYWPDCEDHPCWSAVPAMLNKTPLDMKSFWKRLTWFTNGKGFGFSLQKYVKRLLNPPKISSNFIPHESPDEFSKKFSDESRYYPGKGFARIPESWVSINKQITDSLYKIAPEKRMFVIYDDLCQNTHDVISSVAKFCENSQFDLTKIPQKLNLGSREKWKKNLTEEEKQIIEQILKKNKTQVERFKTLGLTVLEKAELV